MKPNRKARLLIVTSGGGHWVQMLRLRPAFSDFEVAYASVYPDYSERVAGYRYYCVSDASRANPWRFLLLIPQLFLILLRERPGTVLTTGSAPGLAALAVAKLVVGERNTWIDSIANCEQMSSSGRQARRFADVWLTQWPGLANDDGPQYWGSVI